MRPRADTNAELAKVGKTQIRPKASSGIAAINHVGGGSIDNQYSKITPQEKAITPSAAEPESPEGPTGLLILPDNPCPPVCHKHRQHPMSRSTNSV